MKYAWASITKSCTNFGNYLIEYNLKKLLKEKGFTKPGFVFDAFKESDSKSIARINKLDFVIIPGCTTLGLDGYPGIKSILGKTTKPIFNIGAAFFGPTDNKYLEKYKLFSQPIGTRDPEAHSFLIKKGLANDFIGCPTLFTGMAKKFKFKKIKNILFTFGINQIKQQQDLIRKLLSRKYRITVLIQNKKQKEYLKDLKVKSLLYSPINLIRELDKSQLMITGRLHGALPSIARGVPLIFLKTHQDSRFSLLDYLQIKSFEFTDPDFEKELDDEIKNFSTNKNPKIFEQVGKLRKAYSAYLDWLKREISIN